MGRTFKTEQSWWDCVDELEKELKVGETLTGEDAAIFLSAQFEGGTHGNYEGGILWARAKVENDYEITIKRKK